MFWLVVQYLIPTPQAQLNQEQQNPTSWQSMNGAQSRAARWRSLPWREKKLFQRGLYLIWLKRSAPPGLPVCSVVVDTRFKLSSTSLSCLIGRGRHLPACRLPHSLAVRTGHAIYLSGSVSSSSHIHLKTFTKYLADVSRKPFRLLCREPGNQSPESILSWQMLNEVHFASDNGLKFWKFQRIRSASLNFRSSQS